MYYLLLCVVYVLFCLECCRFYYIYKIICIINYTVSTYYIRYILLYLLSYFIHYIPKFFIFIGYVYLFIYIYLLFS